MANIFDDMVIGAPPDGKINSSTGAEVAAPSVLLSDEAPRVEAPTTKTSRPKVPTVGPVAVASKLPDAITPPFPLNHARLLWQNRLVGPVISSLLPLTNRNACLTPSTYNRMGFIGVGSLLLNMSSDITIDAFGIAAHTLKGTRVAIYYSAIAVPWTLIYDDIAPEGAILGLLPTPRQARFFRIDVEAPDGGQIGVVYAGEALQMQRPIYRNVEPVTLNRVTDYTNNESEGGQWLGRDIVRQGLKTSPTWRNLSDAWVRQYFDPFVQSARRLPFFYSWNPQDFPQDVAYCWTVGDIKQTITGPRDLMSVEMELRGHA